MTPAIIFIAITSTACPPCAALHRDFADDTRIQWLDVEDAGQQYRVRVVPTVVAMRGGEEIGRHAGYQGRTEMRRWMASMEAKDASTHRALSTAASRPAARH